MKPRYYPFKVVIYTLNMPDTGYPIYVGATSDDLRSRLINHNSMIKTGNQLIYRFLRSESISPLIEQIEELIVYSTSEAQYFEYFWIDQLSQWGFCLLNMQRNKRYFSGIEGDFISHYNLTRRLAKKRKKNIIRKKILFRNKMID